ncbi:MarR family winged helix-turn-helix transcriptional regulator [Cupriavidus sp. WKF15]|uniref:MarR family winged helix-turn-helix transcriptional regulator n=1 Tax=Cupriavidus sp. WKF15 TaxID=3032282 RepID=UPI0023E2E90E|nr:MarR family winged helix-turn-helix transcriptional regulator [Cupriavidus sp. WKF15]WER50833.1 MarR family winged helix-turn-helix transcriptional regulator [Cupriavidus sp. WKF15]
MHPILKCLSAAALQHTITMKTADSRTSIKAGATGEILRSCLLTRTRQISRVLTALYDDALRPFGINAPQLTLLVMIHELGPIGRAALGRRNHHDRSTLTRNLQPLLAQGWIVEGPPDEDGRTRPLAVTSLGRTLLRDAAPAWSVAQTKATAMLGGSSVEAIMDIGRRLPGPR